MKRSWMVVAVIGVLMFAGCTDQTSQERMDNLKAAVEQAQTVSAKADQYIAALDGQIAEAKKLVESADPNQFQSLVSGLNKLRDQKEVVIAQKAKVDAGIAEWKAEIDKLVAQGDVNFGDEVQAWSKGVQEVGKALPPPASTWLYLIGGLGTIIGGAIGSATRAKKDKPFVEAVPELVGSVEDLLKKIDTEIGVTTGDEAKDILKLAQSSATQQLVNKIRKAG